MSLFVPIVRRRLPSLLPTAAAFPPLSPLLATRHDATFSKTLVALDIVTRHQTQMQPQDDDTQAAAAPAFSMVGHSVCFVCWLVLSITRMTAISHRISLLRSAPFDSLILGHQEKAPRHPNPPRSLPHHPSQLGWKWRELTSPDEQRMER